MILEPLPQVRCTFTVFWRSPLCSYRGMTLLTAVLNSDLLPSGYHLVKGVPIHKGLLRAIPHSLSPSWLKHLCHMSNPKSTARSIPFILPTAASPFPLQLLVRYTMRADLLKCKRPRCADAWRGLLQDTYRMRPTDLSPVEKSPSASSCHRRAVSTFSGAHSKASASPTGLLGDSHGATCLHIQHTWSGWML